MEVSQFGLDRDEFAAIGAYGFRRSQIAILAVDRAMQSETSPAPVNALDKPPIQWLMVRTGFTPSNIGSSSTPSASPNFETAM